MFVWFINFFLYFVTKITNSRLDTKIKVLIDLNLNKKNYPKSSFKFLNKKIKFRFFLLKSKIKV